MCAENSALRQPLWSGRRHDPLLIEQAKEERNRRAARPVGEITSTRRRAGSSPAPTSNSSSAEASSSVSPQWSLLLSLTLCRETCCATPFYTPLKEAKPPSTGITMPVTKAETGLTIQSRVPSLWLTQATCRRVADDRLAARGQLAFGIQQQIAVLFGQEETWRDGIHTDSGLNS